MVGTTLDPLRERHGWTAEEVRSHWNWAPGSGFLNNSEFLLSWRLARNALQTCSIVLAAAVAWKKRLSTPSTASEFARSGFMSGRGRLASNPSSSCCSTLITSVRCTSVSGWEAYGVSLDPSCSQNGDLDDVKEGIVRRCKLFSLWSDTVF